ncbi:alpha/beta fold hydrolase [Leekyejoonella antrihumi]|nr:alpha/beta hydrolase [Leekyejoonella antrihumi]
MSRSRWPLIGAGAGVAAGALTTAGIVVDKLRRNRVTAVRLGTQVSDFEEVADAERVVIAEDGVLLHVEIDEPQGTPSSADGAQVPTIVLTHGYTHNLGVWVFQRRALRAAGYRVVMWDLRGHGRSGEGDDESYTVKQLGRDLAKVIEDVVPDSTVVLVGHSMGAMAVMSLAGQRPELFEGKVIGVGLISTSAGELATIDFGLGKRLGLVVHRLGPAAVSKLSTRPIVLDSARVAGRDLEEYLVHHYSFASHVPLAIVRLTADMIFHTRLHVISVFLPQLMAHDETGSLPTFIGVETLVMHGAQDRIAPLPHGARIVDAIPGCEYVEVAHAGHLLPLEYPDVVSSELLAMIERARRSAPAPRRGVAGTRAVGRAVKKVTGVSAERRAKAVRTGRGKAAVGEGKPRRATEKSTTKDNATKRRP